MVEYTRNPDSHDTAFMPKTGETYSVTALVFIPACKSTQNLPKMKFIVKFVTFFSVVLFFSINLTWGLRCFQCQLKDGIGDAGCGENPPPEKYLRECARKLINLNEIN